MTLDLSGLPLALAVVGFLAAVIGIAWALTAVTERWGWWSR